MAEIAKSYYNQNINKIIMIDTMASLYNRNSIIKLIRKITTKYFIPITMGRNIRSLENTNTLFRTNTNKIAINTTALTQPQLISKITQKYNSQTIIIHIETKITPKHK